MIKFIKRDVTNNILVFFLFLCFWGIMAIGFGFNCLLIDVGDSWSTDTVNRSNDVFKNLSYSYFAGYLVYILTVTIPYYKKRKLVRPIIYSVSNDLLTEALISFLSIYVESLHGLNDLKRQKIEALISDNIKNIAFFKYLWIRKSSCLVSELVNVVYPKIKKDRTLFIDRMSLNMSYLSDNQNKVLNAIIETKVEREITLGFKNNDSTIGVETLFRRRKTEKFGILENAMEPFADYVILLNDFRLLST